MAVLLLVAIAAAGASAQVTVLHYFTGEPDGTFPYAGLIFDKAGNLYGTAEHGGNSTGRYGAGIAFELSPHGNGSWNESVLTTFGDDGGYPEGTLTFDSAGNLYGTTLSGGTFGGGVVFELSPNGSGGWNDTALHNFQGGTNDGYSPLAGIVLDAAGNIYGTTIQGGGTQCEEGCGTAFELSPNGSGGWNESVLYRFCSQTNCTDGYSPYSQLVFDNSGNLYGTTGGGGSDDTGTVFELLPNGNGGWNHSILCGSGLGYPEAGVILDKVGNIYGTSYSTVFELSPNGNGGWNKITLHSFRGGTDGDTVYSGVIMDDAGNLYGTTELGGSTGCGKFHPGCGTVYELTPGSQGVWVEHVLSFGDGRRGAEPYAALVLDGAGNLYGTTYVENNNLCRHNNELEQNCGTVFEIKK